MVIIRVMFVCINIELLLKMNGIIILLLQQIKNVQKKHIMKILNIGYD